MAEPTLDKLTFTLSSDGTYYSVAALNTTISGEVVIPDTYEGLPVKEIKAYAFNGCKSLTLITISDSVTTIGAHAFSNCSKLTSITIPNSVTSIRNGAFSGCSALTSIIIPDSVTLIGNGIFSRCSSLASITVDANNTVYKSEGNCIIEKATNKLIAGCNTSIIPNYVTSIGIEAFSGCTSLTSINIPDSVTSIGSNAFQDCSSLASINIPNSVTSIESNAFYNCISLTSITIPNSVTLIGRSAFWNCSALTSVTIGNGVTSIEESAFARCTSLNNVIIKGKPTVSSGAFNDTTVLEKIYVIEGQGYSPEDTIDGKPIEIIAPEPTLDKLTFTLSSDGTFYSVKALNTSISGDVVIPPEYDSKPVKEIESYAFSYCSSLTSITIPNSVTSIGNQAFSYCSSLTSINIPDSITSIGSIAFSYCSSLTSITVDTNNTVYKSDKNCIIEKATNKLIVGCKTSIIPNYITSIGNQAFHSCTSLTSITIPNSVTSIGNSAFVFCSSLTYITIGNGVTSIGEHAFNGCRSLRTITIPDSVTSIGDGAFYNCSKLASISIPNSVTSIGSEMFYECTSLISVIIGNNVSSLVSDTFYGCSALTNIIIKGKPSVYSNAFRNTTALEKIYVIDGKGYLSTDTIDGKPIEIISEARALELESEWFPISSPFIAYIGTTPITAIYLGSTNISNIL